MIFIGIIWGPAYKYKNEILQDSHDYAKQLVSFDLKLDEAYSDFVYDMYKYEDMPKWKIEKKLEHMHSENNSTINVSFYDIDTTEVFYHQYKKYYVYKNVEGMKMYIREKYKDKVDDYFFDTIFHLTDNDAELLHSINVLKSYMKFIVQKDEKTYESIKKIVQYIYNQSSFKKNSNSEDREL